MLYIWKGCFMEKIDIEIKPRIDGYKKGPPGKAVVCEQDGTISASVMEMAKHLDVSYPLLAKHLAGFAKHAKGYTCRYATEQEICEAGK
jgi:hypothetical protein